VVGRNVPTGSGELDLLARDGGDLVAVEVRTITGIGDPIDAVSPAKRRRVRALAALVGARRVDFVGLGVDAEGVTFHWVPGEV